jgi:hypothetical protein
MPTLYELEVSKSLAKWLREGYVAGRPIEEAEMIWLGWAWWGIRLRR